MKNKIVKALVLASIVSMTATGAAGLTFADENVATGDTATSTTDTATKKTVDELEADLTKAQKTAGEKEAAFTEKLAEYEAAKKASTTDAEEAKEKAKTALGKSVTAEQTARETLQDATSRTENEINNINVNEITDSVLKADFDAYIQARNELKGKSIAYMQAVTRFTDNVVTVNDYDSKDDLAAIATAAEAYKKAKENLEVYAGRVSTLLDGGTTYLVTALNAEKEAIPAYEEALSNLLSAGKVVDDLPTGAELVEALNKAKTELKTATEAYKKALTDLGTAKSAYEEATADLVQIYRLYHPTTHEHLWTKDANEKKVLSTERGWIYEGVAWLTKKKGTDAVPLYRLVYPFSGDHHYTTSENEVKDLTTKYGWISEDVAFYVPKEGDVPVYRLFNPGLKMGAHHFTTGENEYNTLGERGWTKENVAYKVSAKGALDTSEIKTEDSRIAEAEKVYAN